MVEWVFKYLFSYFCFVSWRKNLYIRQQGTSLNHTLVPSLTHLPSKDNVIFQSCILDPGLLRNVGYRTLQENKVQYFSLRACTESQSTAGLCEAGSANHLTNYRRSFQNKVALGLPPPPKCYFYNPLYKWMQQSALVENKGLQTK